MVVVNAKTYGKYKEFYLLHENCTAAIKQLNGKGKKEDSPGLAYLSP